jgi:uncharacterized protein YndB with AHSA1/START domain
MPEAKPIVIERTYRATLDEVWELWTTKDGFESWWGPEGFRADVHELDAHLGGTLRYDMIAYAPGAIAAMKNQGWPVSHSVNARFSELAPRERLTLTNVIDFVPGVKTYENTIGVRLSASADRVKMMITLSPMHSPHFSSMQEQGFTSQLRKLDARFGGT